MTAPRPAAPPSGELPTRENLLRLIRHAYSVGGPEEALEVDSQILGLFRAIADRDARIVADSQRLSAVGFTSTAHAIESAREWKSKTLRLLARVSALEKDAARLDWLEEWSVIDRQENATDVWSVSLLASDDLSLRALIDDAMQGWRTVGTVLSERVSPSEAGR